jgi:hypothetical protein
MFEASKSCNQMIDKVWRYEHTASLPFHSYLYCVSFILKNVTKVRIKRIYDSLMKFFYYICHRISTLGI